MNIKSLIVTLAIAFSFSVSGAVADISQPPGLNFPTPLNNGNSVTGPITNIDPVNQMFQMKDASGIIRSFRVDQNIQILRNGASVQFNNLSLGDTVTVTLK